MLYDPADPSKPLFVLFIPRPGPWLTMNDSHGNYHVKTRTKNLWRQATWGWGTRAGLAVMKAQPPAVISSTFVFTTNRVRDPENWHPTLKVIIDYLVKEFALWPDDNPKYLTKSEPQCTVDRKRGAGVLLVARRRQDDDRIPGL